jgi:hypothetical protein
VIFKTILLSILCSAFLLVGRPAWAGKPETSSSAAPQGSYYLCKLNHIARTIRVKKDADGTCETTYTKEGIDRVVSKSSSLDRCFKVIENIKENLEKAAWKCKDISGARVSSVEN